MSRFVKPEVVRLELSNGDWILVKKRLSAGESRSVFKHSVASWNAGEKIALDPVKAQMALLVEYLVDWSLTDDAGQPVVIRGQPREVLISALDNLTGEDSSELQKALEKHIEMMDVEKKVQSGAIESAPT